MKKQREPKSPNDQGMDILDAYFEGKNLKKFMRKEKPKITETYNERVKKAYLQDRKSVDEAINKLPKTEVEIKE